MMTFPFASSILLIIRRPNSSKSFTTCSLCMISPKQSIPFSDFESSSLAFVIVCFTPAQKPLFFPTIIFWKYLYAAQLIQRRMCDGREQKRKKQ